MAETVTTKQQILSSCFGALITSLLMTPFDVVKTRLQTQQSMYSNVLQGRCGYTICNGILGEVCLSCKRPPPLFFTGTLDAFLKIATTEGLISLWRGLPPTLMMALPATVVYYSAYDKFKEYYQLRIGTPYAALLAGVTARVGASTLISPLEMIRTKAQSMSHVNRIGYRELIGEVRVMIQRHGVPILYKGLIPTLLRDVPFSAVYWSCYESLMTKFYYNRDSDALQSKFRSSFFCGAISGTVAATLTTPFDVTKTYRQIDWESPGPRSSMLQIAQTIIARDGWRGMFVGLTPRLAKIAPACAIMISCYETGKMYFGQVQV